MKKIIELFLALILLAGCSQASIPDTSTSTARATETVSTAASITAEPTQEPIYKLNISDIPAYTGVKSQVKCTTFRQKKYKQSFATKCTSQCVMDFLCDRRYDSPVMFMISQ